MTVHINDGSFTKICQGLSGGLSGSYRSRAITHEGKRSVGDTSRGGGGPLRHGDTGPTQQIERSMATGGERRGARSRTSGTVCSAARNEPTGASRRPVVLCMPPRLLDLLQHEKTLTGMVSPQRMRAPLGTSVSAPPACFGRRDRTAKSQPT